MYKITSKITGKTYSVSSAVKILNIQQITAYLKYGVELLELQESPFLYVCLTEKKVRMSTIYGVKEN